MHDEKYMGKQSRIIQKKEKKNDSTTHYREQAKPDMSKVTLNWITGTQHPSLLI
ncbi:hypothetical protein KDA_49940 [Dictyobacter alpinus]|uniref:Uncharacterized protein n=1 Tax=Dictyobacter alpinus TaxID=2014873 RepID=A0A402BDY6_9CHLR|nr:hypothetical protein KDA_49940 [Dictyobacter alpinus]